MTDYRKHRYEIVMHCEKKNSVTRVLGNFGCGMFLKMIM